MPFEIITVDELSKRLSKLNHKELHVHHTFSPSHKNFNGKNGIELQNNMARYHKETRHFTDIAQHVTLLPDGTFVTGRNFLQDPASIKYHNDQAFCVEMLGNFDKGVDKLEGKQLESIIKIAKLFDAKGKYIRFHRENAPKTCPGTGIDKGEFMKLVKKVDKPKVALKPCKFGDEGANVKLLQTLLHIKVDGFFGHLTLKAVKDFQEKNKLTVDGIVGAKTIAKLKG